MNAVDMAASIVPKSDQLNAEDLLTGPRTVTITEVRRGASAEQPVDIHLAEFDRPFKPSKTVRRILVNAWGPDAATYVGRRMTIYRDPAVKFGGMDVGGIRISHLSHIDKRLSVALTVTKGRRAPYVVDPLTSPPSEPITPTLSKQRPVRAETAPELTEEQKAEAWLAKEQPPPGPQKATAQDDRAAEPMITTVLSKRLYGLLKAAGHGETNAALAYLSEKLDRNVMSTKELTKYEAIGIIEGLERPVQPTAPAQPSAPEQLWPEMEEPADDR